MNKNTVIYQIYPLSFYDSNGDGYGDLKGIIQKLDYLVDLGINTIWLSPIYSSPMKDFGYDISNYYSIDPKFGTQSDFDTLIKKSHSKGIKVLLDYVPNHTSDQHPWFIKSRSSTTNPKRDWYIWRKGKGNKIPPNNWISVFGGSSWEYDLTTDEWYLHDFLKEQPDLNWRNPEVKKEMLNVLDYWLQRGVDGFRLDSMGFLFEDPGFPDDPQNTDYNSQTQIPWYSLKRKHDFNLPEVNRLIKEITQHVSKYPDIILLTEIYEDFEKIKNMYFTYQSTSHIPFNFDLMFLPWDAQIFKKTIETYDKAVGPQNTPNYVLGNHDQPRIISRVGAETAKLLAFIQLTLRGIPIIYYGEEIGMENTIIDNKDIKDPLGIQVGHQFSRDPQRTPMQWNNAKNTGFSSHTPWLRINSNYSSVNVEMQKNSPHSFFHLYKKLIHLKKTNIGLSKGSLVFRPISNPSILSYERKTHSYRIMMLCNFSNKKQLYTLGSSEEGRILYSTTPQKPAKVLLLNSITLEPLTGYIIEMI